MIPVNGLLIHSGQIHRGVASSYSFFMEKKSSYQGLELFTSGKSILDIGTSNKKLPKQNEALGDWNWLPYQSAFWLALKAYEISPFFVNWGGDHSIAVSTVGAFLKHYSNGYVIWIDAHADLNIPLFSPTGNLHGMPVGILLNLFGVKDRYLSWLPNIIDPQRIVYLGLRDLDPFEEEMINRLDILNLTSKELSLLKPQRVVEIVKDLVGNYPVHLSFDVDVMDPQCMPCTGVQVADGLSIRWVEDFLYFLISSVRVTSLDLVEVNFDLGDMREKKVTMDSLSRLLLAIAAATDYTSKRGVFNEGNGFTTQNPDSASV